ncbi:MAG: DUF1853 family protein [Endozoicomonadaceae bacterium]|nr:DUF1853 family protein [Endozoicomonadaceae bacterium]
MTFKHRCVQDLAWVIQSPPVISGVFNHTRWLNKTACQHEYNACLPALRQLDRQPEPLLKQLSTLKPYVIGRRFECYVRYWLMISPHFECLQHSYILEKDKRTLGEADFIIRELSTNKIIHLEVAVKFYLGINRDIDQNQTLNSTETTDISAMHHWHGTNLRDRLDIKFNRLTNHQTQLAKNYPEQMPYAIDESWCLLKGRMFTPLAQQTLPDFFADECPQGIWLSTHDAPKTKTHLLLQKQDWLAEVVGYSGEPHTISRDLKYSACFATLANTQENQAGMNEEARFFVLPENFFQNR